MAEPRHATDGADGRQAPRGNTADEPDASSGSSKRHPKAPHPGHVPDRASRSVGVSADTASLNPSTRWLWAMDRSQEALAGHGVDLAEIADQAGGSFGLGPIEIARDYYLQRALKAVADEWPPGTPVCDPHDGKPILQWAFTGGTALTNAHRIADRYSEDMDLVLIPLTEEPLSPGARRRCRKLIQAFVIDAVKGWLDTETEIKDGRQVATVLFEVGGIKNFLKVDVADMPLIEDAVTETETWSLMGRVATEKELKACPELGGFKVPTVAVEVTAAGKLMTQYQTAAAAAHDRLRERARDLYDLACIANSEPHADRARARVPEVAGVLFSEGIQSWFTDAPRPSRGLGSSLAYVGGTDAYIILRVAYENALHMVWGDWRPTFQQAVELAKSLDYHPRPVSGAA